MSALLRVRGRGFFVFLSKIQVNWKQESKKISMNLLDYMSIGV
jgi:hypothetical protein